MSARELSYKHTVTPTSLEVHVVVQTDVSEVFDHAHKFGKVRFEVIDLLVTLRHS